MASLVPFLVLGSAFLVSGNAPFAPGNIIEDAFFWAERGSEALTEALRRSQLPREHRAKNVIFFVGDGMGSSVLTAARIYRGQMAGKTGEEGSLAFESFPYLSLVKTYSVDHQVPDSASTATAMFTGVKTRSSFLGLDATADADDCTSRSRVPSLLQWAQDEGKYTGLVTTTRVTHATPAALYAHVPNRNWECDTKIPREVHDSVAGGECKDIARQLVEERPGQNLRVIMGGGRQQFLDFVPEDQRVRACYREDRRNLIATWANHKVSLNASFMYLETTEDLERLDPARTDYVMGLFDMNHMSYEVDRNKTAQGQPHLATMTQKAIEMLQRGPKGYFLMVEGGRIDHGLHDNKAHRAIQETLAFEEAVRIAMELTSPKDTLIVVTADHDHVMTINGYPKRGNDILGVASNGEVDGLPYTTLMFTTGGSYDYKCTKILDYGGNILGVLPLRKNISDTDTRDTEYRQLSGVWNRYGGETHGGQDVPLYAQGPGAHLFTGLQEQSYIAHAISYSACMGPHKKDCLAGQNPKHPAKPFTSGTSPFHEAQHAPHLLSLSIVSLVTFYGL